MKDNSSQEEKPVDATAKNAASPQKGTIPKRQSSGRGLYITAIVLGIIIVLLLALYIFLAITHQKPSHAFIAPLPAIVQITKS
jgi:type VI protein secretion system component VasF